MSTLQERVDRERLAHTEDDVLANNIRVKERFSHIETLPGRRRLHTQISDAAQRHAGKHVLDYGCGRGDMSLIYLDMGCRVTGIDISDVYVADAARRADAAGHSSDMYDFRVMDCHALDLPDESVDLIIGLGILHHLQVDVALEEARRVLKKGGELLLLEPLADNPLLKLFRLLTPSARTKDEAPFTGSDLRRIAALPGWQVDYTYSGLISLPVAMATSLLMPSRPDNSLVHWADSVERWFHRHRILNSWNQYAVFSAVTTRVQD